MDEKDWDITEDLANQIMMMLEGLQTNHVMHALELVYASIGVSTNTPLHSLMNNVMTHYKTFKKEQEESE
jgi:hypothetical protein